MNQPRYWIAAATCVVLMFFLSWTLTAQTRPTTVEVEGTASQVNAKAGTFSMEGLKVTTSPTTRYEDRQDQIVNKEAFFSSLHGNERIQVEGRLNGNTITADKVEVD